MGASEKRRVDEKGRVTIPQAIRESLQIDQGEEVDVTLEDDHIVIQPRISRDELVAELGGCIDEDSLAEDAERIDPLDLKDEWTEDLPD